jgi:hypothetical protein
MMGVMCLRFPTEQMILNFSVGQEKICFNQ